MTKTEEVTALQVGCPRCKAKPSEHCDIVRIHSARLAKATLEPGHYVVTVSGKRIYLENPDPAMINIMDIAHGLSNICRFHGQTRTLYTVAEHCVLVASMMQPYRNYQLAALLHDAEEAYLGDTPQPFKQLVNRASHGLVEYVHAKLTNTILAGLLGENHRFTDHIWHEVEAVDKQIAIHEMETYCAENFYDRVMDDPKYPRFQSHQIQLGEPLSPKEAKIEFLQCYGALMTSWGAYKSNRTGKAVLFKGPSGTRT